MFKDQLAYKKYIWFIDKFKSNTLVETGTFRGESTIIFSTFHENVITCDISEKSIKSSKRKFKSNGFYINDEFSTKTYDLKVYRFTKNQKNIWLVHGSSELVIESLLLGELNFKFKNPYTFFLDAHGDFETNYWPIIDELKLISKFDLKDTKVIIHDFKVPGFDGWGYDSYNGQVLDYEYVSKYLFMINPKYLSFFPNKVGDGHGRGILYSVSSDELDFDEYVKLNRGNPPININEREFTQEEINKTKTNFHFYKKINNLI